MLTYLLLTPPAILLALLVLAAVVDLYKNP